MQTPQEIKRQVDLLHRNKKFQLEKIEKEFRDGLKGLQSVCTHSNTYSVSNLTLLGSYNIFEECTYCRHRKFVKHILK